MRLLATNLYAVKVGSVGSFLVAAVDATQARAMGEQWRDEKNLTGHVTVKRASDHRHVYIYA